MVFIYYFNEVRGREDRKNTQLNIKEVGEFNEFISDTQLIEILLGGRKFSRISDDGSKFSKLDRFFCHGWVYAEME